MLPKVYSYVRMSSSKQSEGSSESRQAEPAVAYAAGVRLELDDSYRDIGVSAGRGRHRKSGAMKAFIDKIGTEIVAGSILYVEAMDRLNREEFDDAYTMVASILKSNINIYDAEDEKLYTKESLKDNSAISNLVTKITHANEYYKRLSRRINISKKKVLLKAREEGRKLTKVCPGWLRLVGNEFERIEDRVAVVEQMFALAIEGYGAPTIAQRLNDANTPQFTREEQGHKVKKKVGGKGWSASHIAQILQSETVKGLHQPTTRIYDEEKEKFIILNNGPPIAEYYPIIIDETVFNQAQAARKKNVKGSNRNLNKPGSVIKNLFSGKMMCAYCSGPAMLITNTKRKKGYLYCQNFTRKKKGGCEARGTFDYALLEKAALARLSLMDSEGLFRHSKPTASIQKLQAEATRLGSLLEAGEKTLAEWLEQPASDRVKRLLAAKEAELDATEQRLKDVQAQIEEASTASLGEQAGVVTLLREQAEAGSVPARLKVRNALRSLISSIEIDVVQKHAEIYCASDFIFTVYSNGYTVDIETGGPAETMGRTFTINRPA